MKRIVLALLILSLVLPLMALGEAALKPSATIEEAVEVFLADRLALIGRDTTDPWQRFICAQGLKDIKMNLKWFTVESRKPLPVTFTLVSANPRVLDQPPYEGDPETWLKGVAETMHLFNAHFELEFRITPQDGGYVASFAASSDFPLSRAVRSLSEKAQQAFTSKVLLSAITDYMMPIPVASSYKSAPKSLSPADYTPAYRHYLSRNGLNASTAPLASALLYAVRGYELDVSGGPENFRLSYLVPEMSDLISAGADTLSHYLNFDASAKKYTPGEQKTLLVKQIEQEAIRHRYQGSEVQKETCAFSFFSLPQSLNPEALYVHPIENIQESFANAGTTVADAVAKMPEYPALPNPKNGLFAGRSKGSKFHFKSNPDGFLRTVKVYDAVTHQLNCALFLDGGISVVVRIPEGAHYMVIGMGKLWYGEEHLLGAAASYVQTPPFTVQDNHYVYTVMLNPKYHGNTEVDLLDYQMVVDKAGDESAEQDAGR